MVFGVIWLVALIGLVRRPDRRAVASAWIVALLGLKRSFGVTPKGVGGAIPLVRLWPELLLLAANVATAAYGFYWMSRYGLELAYGVNTVWATYHTVLLSTLFVHFNRRVTVPPHVPLFEPAKAA